MNPSSFGTDFYINFTTMQTLLNYGDSSTPWQLAQPHLPHFPLCLGASVLYICSYLILAQ